MRLIDADKLKTGSVKVFVDGKEDERKYIIADITDAPTIEAEPAWKSASVNPQESGTYLTVWDLCRNQKPFASYKILNYGDFEDWNDELKPKTGWWEFDSEWGVCDMTEAVLYWMPLPEPPKEDNDAEQ